MTTVSGTIGHGIDLGVSADLSPPTTIPTGDIQTDRDVGTDRGNSWNILGGKAVPNGEPPCLKLITGSGGCPP